MYGQFNKHMPNSMNRLADLIQFFLAELFNISRLHTFASYLNSTFVGIAKESFGFIKKKSPFNDEKNVFFVKVLDFVN